MFGKRSNKFPDYYLNQRTLTQAYKGCVENKRYLFLLTLCLFTIPIIVLFSSTPVDVEAVQNDDNYSKLLDIIRYNNRTLCSEEADRRGNKQRIISLTLFGPKENRLFRDETFTNFITPLLQEAKTLFPTWTVRLYTDESSIIRLNLKNLSRIASNIDICNVNQLPVLGNIGEYLPGKVWRFIPALDPMVDYATSRDLDSPLIKREQTVIEQFMNSSFSFLSLRDHHEHFQPILGGMWTAALYRNRLLFLDAFSVLLNKDVVKKYVSVHDQTLLTEFVWPKVKHETLVFDAYSCQKHEGAYELPYPTQRDSRDCHIGCIKPCCNNSTKIYMLECPEKCRPKEHPEWLYC
jgi:hypothetical protein